MSNRPFGKKVGYPAAIGTFPPLEQSHLLEAHGALRL